MRFSVVVPLYNKEQFIQRTLQSIFDQTFADYELIVVDDGSTDQSYSKACAVVKNNNPNQYVVTQENEGVASARNKGAAMAKGDYICFLDSDDWWEPDFLEEIDRLITEYPDAGLYGTSFYLVKNGQQRVAPIGFEHGFIKGYINYCQTYARTLCMPITSSSVAIPRAGFMASGGFRSHLTLGEDFDLWIRLAISYPVAMVNKPLANYFQDLPPSKRATRRLHDPRHHMLWNLDYLSNEEAANPDLKLLLDRLRGSGLFRYYLSHNYHDEALEQIEKIDWSHMPRSIYRLYHTPLWFQRIRSLVHDAGSTVKQTLIKLKVEK